MQGGKTHDMSQPSGWQMFTNCAVVVLAAAAVFSMGGTGHIEAIVKRQPLAQWKDAFSTTLTISSRETTTAVQNKRWKLEADLDVDEDAWEPAFKTMFGKSTTVPVDPEWKKVCTAPDLEWMTAVPVVDYSCNEACCKSLQTGTSKEQTPYYATLTVPHADDAKAAGKKILCYHVTAHERENMETASKTLSRGKDAAIKNLPPYSFADRVPNTGKAAPATTVPLIPIGDDLIPPIPTLYAVCTLTAYYYNGDGLSPPTPIDTWYKAFIQSRKSTTETLGRKLKPLKFTATETTFVRSLLEMMQLTHLMKSDDISYKGPSDDVVRAITNAIILPGSDGLGIKTNIARSFYERYAATCLQGVGHAGETDSTPLADYKTAVVKIDSNRLAARTGLVAWTAFCVGNAPDDALYVQDTKLAAALKAAFISKPDEFEAGLQAYRQAALLGYTPHFRSTIPSVFAGNTITDKLMESIVHEEAATTTFRISEFPKGGQLWFSGTNQEKAKATGKWVAQLAKQLAPLAGAFNAGAGISTPFISGPLIPHLRLEHANRDADLHIQKRDGKRALDDYTALVERGLQPGLNTLSPASELTDVDCLSVPSPGVAYEMAAFYETSKRLSGFTDTFGAAGEMIAGEEVVALPDLFASGAIAASALTPFGAGSSASPKCTKMCKISTRLWFPTQVLSGLVTVWLLVCTYKALSGNAERTSKNLMRLLAVVLFVTFAMMVSMLVSMSEQTKPKMSCGFNGAGNAAGINYVFSFNNAGPDGGVEYTFAQGYWWLLGSAISYFFIFVWVLVSVCIMRADPFQRLSMTDADEGMLF